MDGEVVVYSAEGTITEAVKETAERHPDRTAIIYEDEKVTYSELIRRVGGAAALLRAEGLEDGDRVALLLSNRPEYAVYALATFALGGVCVPLNTRLAPDEVHYILDDSSSRFLVTERGFEGRVSEPLKGCSTVERVVMVDEVSEYGDEELSVCGGGADSVALIAYTSGTTGRLKGAQLTHRNLLSNTVSCLKTMELKPRDNFLCILPLSHTFPFTVCLLVPLVSGTTTTMVSSVRPFKRVMRSVFRNRVTVFVGVPQLFRAMANAPRPGIFTRLMFRFFNPMRFCICGADPLPVDVLERFERRFRVPLLEGYGLTEASPVVCFNRLGARKKGSVGQPIEGVEVRVVSDAGEVLPVGEEGELCVRGENVMKGYLNCEEETAECIRDGWLRTGDVARIDEDGFVHIVGRKKDMISVKGAKVYPPEIETVLMSHPVVADCAVCGVADEHSGEVPVAAVVLEEGGVVTEGELKAFLRGKVADYKLPRRILFLDELPKTATAKVRRHILKSLIDRL